MQGSTDIRRLNYYTIIFTIKWFGMDTIDGIINFTINGTKIWPINGNANDTINDNSKHGNIKFAVNPHKTDLNSNAKP